MTDADSLVQRGLALHQRGKLSEAAVHYRQALHNDPGHAEANHLLGLLEHQTGQREEALEHLARAVAAAPGEAAYHSNLGVVLQSLGRLPEASESYRKAIDLDEGIAAVHNNLGVVLHGMAEFADARRSLERALALDPHYAEAHANLGLTLQALKLPEQAEAEFRRAIALKPGYAKAHDGLGSLLRELRRYDDAVTSYRSAVSASPLDPVFHNHIGIALEKSGDLAEALDSYRRAIAYRPAYIEAHANLGDLLAKTGQTEEAVAAYRNALAINPGSIPVNVALASALLTLGKLDQAAEIQRKVCDLDQGNGSARAEYWRTLGHGCDWRQIDELRAEIARFVEGLGVADDGRAGTPFPILAMVDDPGLHLKAASAYARRIARREKADAPYARERRGLGGSGKIRLAYLSADFHAHATAYLTAELFEQHDRERFEIHAISFGPPGDSPMRRRLEGAFSGFHDLHEKSARDIAQAVAELGIDIAVDLKGYTQDARTGIFAHRPAPIQVQYLGYPGTMGVDFIDYVIADPIVIPEAEQIHYAEKIAYLPHSYQVNDRHRPLPAARPSRAECGLPETGFVFAAFNANYKITPEMFSAWMRLLGQVEGSVLWLFESNSWARRNLRSEAAARGVDPERLVFAGHQPLAQHLARIGNADLFVDTLPYNAHTTASDALWVGLPVVTLAGRSFAGRVAASLLTAAGLPELITTSLDEYETLALSLATTPARLARLRQKLERERLTAPLFDTPAFARHLEAAYGKMWQRHIDGGAPETFHIEAH